MKSKLTTVEDCFRYLGEDPTKLPIVDHLPEEDQKDVINNFTLKKVVKAINKEFNGGVVWEPNYIDGSIKYELWPDVLADEKRPGGFGLSCRDFVTACTYTIVGSRLSFISLEAAKHCFNHFTPLYIQELLIVK